MRAAIENKKCLRCYSIAIALTHQTFSKRPANASQPLSSLKDKEDKASLMYFTPEQFGTKAYSHKKAPHHTMSRSRQFMDTFGILWFMIAATQSIADDRAPIIDRDKSPVDTYIPAADTAVIDADKDGILITTESPVTVTTTGAA